MHPSFIDRYSRLNSPIHRLPAATKFGATILFISAALVAPVLSPLIWVVEGSLLLFIATLSTIPAGFLIRRMLFLEIFVLGIAGLSVLQPHGLAVFTGLTVKSTLCLFTIVLFSNTTPFTDLLEMLRRWKMPALFVTLLALLYRYLFLFVDELERMRRARLSRTFSNRRSGVWHSYATIVAQLFVRSIERAERVYASMCARGWE
jgi:cobalt/nickel transport system permease protein